MAHYLYYISMSETKILSKKNYLAMIRNAAKGQNHMFQNLYASIDGQETDIVDNGNLSCAFFLSGVLFINKLIRDMHANMSGLEKDLLASGWQQSTELKEGAILVWEPLPSDKQRNFQPTGLHAGFYIGNDHAISNGSRSTLMPEEHHYTYDGTRKVVRIWWHPSLD